MVPSRLFPELSEPGVVPGQSVPRRWGWMPGRFLPLIRICQYHYSCKMKSVCDGLAVGAGGNVISLQRSCSRFCWAFILMKPWARRQCKKGDRGWRADRLLLPLHCRVGNLWGTHGVQRFVPRQGLQSWTLRSQVYRSLLQNLFLRGQVCKSLLSGTSHRWLQTAHFSFYFPFREVILPLPGLTVQH